jgi:hypothetical protein
MGKSCLENYCNRYFLFLKASELVFLSINVSLLVLLLSIFCCSTSICLNIFCL